METPNSNDGVGYSFQTPNKLKISKNKIQKSLFENWSLKIGHSSYLAGYTLIEILITLTIIGLIFGFGYISFREFSQRQALSGLARSIKGDLRLAQESALAGKKPSGINCNSPNLLNGYYFQRVSSTNYTLGASCSAGTIESKSVNLPADVTMSSFSPNPIIFKVLGQGTNISGSTIITLTQISSGNTRTITITDGGEIK
jgi:prepilin-type N-terminal cleavage/methylation domain-containing protein